MPNNHTNTTAKDDPCYLQLLGEVTTWAAQMMHQGVFKDEPDDNRMLGEISRLLKESHPDLTVNKIDQAIKGWIELNDSMVPDG